MPRELLNGKYMSYINTQRDLSFDILRAIATLWIVGVLHILSQTGLADIGDWKYGIPISNTCLAGFICMSGYFLSKYRFESKQDVIVFLKKRFFRFYILFFISALTLFVAGPLFGFYWFSSLRQFVFCITGLSTFFPPQPSTLWFISLLMVLYISTPFVLYKHSGKPLWIILLRIALLLFPTLILLCFEIDTDKHFFSYVLFYYAAILIPHAFVEENKKRYWLLIPSLICWLGCVWCVDCIKTSGMLWGEAVRKL